MHVSAYFNFLAALAIVLCLIGILAWIAKWLGLEELKPLDSRRKLALLRCDDREHLVLLNQGQAADLLLFSQAPARSADAPADPDLFILMQQR